MSEERNQVQKNTQNLVFFKSSREGIWPTGAQRSGNLRGALSTPLYGSGGSCSGGGGDGNDHDNDDDDNDDDAFTIDINWCGSHKFRHLNLTLAVIAAVHVAGDSALLQNEPTSEVYYSSSFHHPYPLDVAQDHSHLFFTLPHSL